MLMDAFFAWCKENHVKKVNLESRPDICNRVNCFGGSGSLLLHQFNLEIHQVNKLLHA